MMKTILVVEDELQLQESMAKKLTESGFAVSQAFDANEALEQLAKSHPDLILLDIILPGGKNGFDVLEQIKRNVAWANIPVIILTNLDSEKDVAMKMQASDYVVKTNISLDELVKKIRARIPE